MNEIEYHHSVLVGIRDNNTLLKENNSKMDVLLSSLKEMISLQRELLNFFVAIDKRDSGLDDTNSIEYLTELKKDGFEPRME